MKLLQIWRYRRHSKWFVLNLPLHIFISKNKTNVERKPLSPLLQFTEWACAALLHWERQLWPSGCFQLGWTIKHGQAELALGRSGYSVKGSNGVEKRESDEAWWEKGRLVVIWPSWACPHLTESDQMFPEMRNCRQQQVLIKRWNHLGARRWLVPWLVFTSCPYVRSFHRSIVKRSLRMCGCAERCCVRHAIEGTSAVSKGWLKDKKNNVMQIH